MYCKLKIVFFYKVCEVCKIMFVIMVKKHRNSICILSLLNVGYKHFSG